MYRAHAPAVVARIIITDPKGDPSELTSWTNFHCEGSRPVLRDLKACATDPTSRPLGYILRDQQLHLDSHLANTPGPETIEITLRSYQLGNSQGAPSHSDCIVARCTGRRRD